jgi:hypothetical protein
MQGSVFCQHGHVTEYQNTVQRYIKSYNIFHLCTMYVCMYVQRSFRWKPENLGSWRPECWTWHGAKSVTSGRYSDMLRNQLKPASSSKTTPWFVIFWRTSAGCQTPGHLQPVISWNRFRISNCRCYPVRHLPQISHRTIFTSFGP